MMRASIRAPMTARASIALLLFVGGCSHKVGDPCQTNVDCSPLGDRFCDIASPNGYCTIEGCDVSRDFNGQPLLNSDGTPQTSCPSEAVCIRFFTPIAAKPCALATADHDCAVSELCLCDCGDPNDPTHCLTPSLVADANGNMTESCICSGAPSPIVAHCAPESSERRSCQLACSSDSDCRTPLYACRTTGTHGAEPLPTRTVTVGAGGSQSIIAVGAPVKFCVQVPQNTGACVQQ